MHDLGNHVLHERQVLPHQFVLVRRPFNIDLGVQDAPRHPKRLLPEALQRFRPQQASPLIIPGVELPGRAG